MTITALQEAQDKAEDLALQLELLASNAQQLSTAKTPEAVYYGLCWIQSILQGDILHILSISIDDMEFLINRELQDRQGTTDNAGKEKA